MHKRLFSRKAIIIIMAIVAIISLLLFFSESFRKTVEDAVLPDESKLSQTHNASRYFFRFGYPDDWMVEADVSDFGFVKDIEKGIVVSAYPKSEYEKAKEAQSATDITATPESTAETDSEAEQEESVMTKIDVSTFVDFYYRDVTGGEVASSKVACEKFMEEFESVLMIPGEGMTNEFEFSEITEYVADNVTFYRVTYTCETFKARNTEASTHSESVGKSTGEIYVALRSMAYYAIVFDTEYDKDSEAYKDYYKDFINIINDFRFSVFED